MSELKELAHKLNYKEKVERSLDLISAHYSKYRDRLVVANSLGKDSCVVWDLAKKVSSDIRGFIVTTRYKPIETITFMSEVVAKYPELAIYKNDATLEDGLWQTDPNRCCEVLKVEPTRNALKELNAECWVTGLRCTEGEVRTEYQEVEERDKGLIKLNPILLWTEREIWQYLALEQVPVNPKYKQGYRSLGCAPCSNIIGAGEENERAGRWEKTGKCGGECGIHTRPLKEYV